MSTEATDAELSAEVEANVARVLVNLDDWARHMAARYCGPVHLVGSTLHSPTPRDCDVRIIIPDHEFAARYGMRREQEATRPGSALHERGIVAADVVQWDADGPSQRWIDDVSKFNAQISSEKGLNMDIKVWPESKWRTPYPRPITLAAPSPRWFIYSAHCPDPATPPPAPHGEPT